MAKQDKIHQRLSDDLPINSRVAITIVADPYSRIGEQIQVLRSTRDDPLAGMHSRAQIDDAMMAAGRKWQELYECSQIGGIGAIDPGKEAVDGGRFPEPISDRQIKAFRKLNEARLELGGEGYHLIVEILGSRVSIADAACVRGYQSKDGKAYIGRRFRECLNTLAVHWGFAQAVRT